MRACQMVRSSRSCYTCYFEDKLTAKLISLRGSYILEGAFCLLASSQQLE